MLDFATMHEPPAGGPFHTRIRVRYEETDAAGVVYYANYLVYFEVARVEALRAVGMPIAALEERGVLLPAVSANCTYHSPGRVDDALDVAMWTDHVGRASFGFAYEVRRAGDGATALDAPLDEDRLSAAPLIASGATRHAVVARDTMRPVRIEGWIAELMTRAQEWRPPS
jgi:acyl-CoA thioester hydrolase